MSLCLVQISSSGCFINLNFNVGAFVFSTKQIRFWMFWIPVLEIDVCVLVTGCEAFLRFVFRGHEGSKARRVLRDETERRYGNAEEAALPA